MIPSTLIKTLARELRKATANFTLQAEYQSDKKVSVYEGYIPTEKFETQTFLPMIVVELRGVTDDTDLSTATIGLVFAVYGGEDAKYGGGRDLQNGFKDYGDGWWDLINLAECVRQYLMRLPDGFLGDFRLILPMTFVPQADQPAPFFYGEMLLQFEVANTTFPINYPAEFEESKVLYKVPHLNI